MFINLGNDYKLNDKTRFSFEFEKTFFGDLNVDWSANANLSVGGKIKCNHRKIK
ncbi:hypothetical protein HFY02_000476 [Campylobacter jejuni]|nr:hypothetical protein [Campylobacter jejuni]